MPDNDFSVGSVQTNPFAIKQIQKPSYLIKLENGKKPAFFMTVDKIDYENNFVKAKGVFLEIPESEINEKYQELLTNVKRELLCEMMFPNHRVIEIKNVLYKANSK